MSNCRLTVVTVCRNSIEYIERAIKSVLHQSYKNIEYIIIDGSSSDGTIEVIKKYSPYISYWISEPDQGVYQAMNKGIKAATGDLIGFLSSNDWYAEGALSAIADKYDETHADVIYGDAVVYDGEKITHQDYSKAKLEDSFYYMTVIHPAFFVKTDIQKKYGFDESYRICADYKFFMQVYRDSYQFAYTKQDIIHYYLGGISSDREKTSIEDRRASYEVLGEEKWRYTKGIEKVFFENFYFYPEVFIKNGFGRGWIRKNMNSEEDIYIFGTGNIGEKAYYCLQDAGMRLVCFVDNAKSKQGTKYHDLPIISLESLRQFQKGIIFISSYDYADEIEVQLLSSGIQSYLKIIRADVFFTRMVKDYIAIINKTEGILPEDLK